MVVKPGLCRTCSQTQKTCFLATQLTWFMFISVWAASVISPLELIRTKMQSEKLTYRQVHTAIKGMLRHEGFLSLWKGLGPSLLRDVPFSGKHYVNTAMQLIDNFSPCYSKHKLRAPNEAALMSIHSHFLEQKKER